MKWSDIWMINLTFWGLFVGCDNQPSPDYTDASLPVDDRVEALLKEMTLAEKIDQLTMLVMGKSDNANNTEDREGRMLTPETGAFIYYSPNVDVANELQRRAREETRLGIPVLLGHDVIHGYRTLFPMPLAQACSWNKDLVYQAARHAAKESYLSGLRWTFSPMLDVARDGRWGRVAESYGEDPFANAEYAKLVVQGYQGDQLSDAHSIAACLKHFAGYAYSQSGRDYNPTDVSDLSLWETVLPPFKAALDQGAATVMSSFNDLNGVPTVANRFLLTEVLRDRWDFDGFVVSDWRAIEQLITQRYAADSLDASVKAIEAGNDMDMYDYLYKRYLPQALQQNQVPEQTIDEAVRRILKVKFELGLFENPYTPKVADQQRYLTPDAVKASKQMAAESMVLLKNKGQILPLKSNVKRVLLVGPMVYDRLNMMGTWRSHALEEDVITLAQGLEDEFQSRIRFEYVSGVDFKKNDEAVFANLKKKSKGADVIILALGEHHKWSGENGTKATLELPKSQVELIKEATKLNLPLILLTASGRPLAMGDIEPCVDAIVQMWQPGLYGGDALAGILSGRINPSGRLAITFPRLTGQLPLFYNYRINARNAWGKSQGCYQDAPVTPLYPFGYGLSYSNFVYQPVQANKREFSKHEKIKLSVEVKNESLVDGQETVFWYVDDPVASITQPVKKLKHFEKQWIPAGKSRVFTFEVDPMRDLSFVDARGEEHLEAGLFHVLVGDQVLTLHLTSSYLKSGVAHF